MPRRLLLPLITLALLLQPVSPAYATVEARTTQGTAAADPPPAASLSGTGDQEHVRESRRDVSERAPLPASADALRRDYDDPRPAPHRRRPSAGNATARAAACDVAGFTGRTGGELVRHIRSVTTDCVNTLFGLTGADARGAFREAQMVSVADALRADGPGYPGDNSAGTAQLVLYLRAGYYVQWYHPDDVGSYGSQLRTAIRAGLDAFFANPRAWTVSDANGEVLSEAVVLIDSAQQNDRYLDVVERLLNGYDSSYDASWWMLNAVNGAYTVLFRGHQVPAFVSAVQADTGVLRTLESFATRHLALLGTERGYLTANAGRELARFLQHAALRDTVRPMARGLLGRSAVTGPTARLWVGVAEMADAYDRANCSFYGTCDLAARLAAEVLPITHSCGPAIRIRAQAMTSGQLSGTCTGLAGQDGFFHDLARDGGRPVADDHNTTLEVVVFDSSTDYQTYAGPMFGIDTDNGGMYLEGDPSRAGNQPRFIAYEAEWLRPAFQIWNLNHEYTHYLDGRFNMHGDFTAGVSTPTIWWIEGFAEYVSYSYRKVIYDAAITEAGRRTYALSTLWDTTYDHDSTRVYRWGYLAVRYMYERHRADVDTVLGHYRTGSWNAARTFLTGTIGTRYDADWTSWLAACAAGACSGGGSNQAPTAGFTVAASGLTASFTDTSADPDGTITARRWEFGDGATSTAANPAHTYSAAGTYTARLTVTDDDGATGTVSRQVSVSAGGGQAPECTDPDTRRLDRDCRRSGLSAPAGDYAYLYLYLPAGVGALTITAAGGTGDADLYYSDRGWATTSSHTRRATGAGNQHSITVTSPAAGWHYVSLHGAAAFSGAAVTTEY
ncbi:collagenase [Nonomuraea muscovyensis]|uniref:microbial collagenase n=1 Tax=Nonomuraea muscovyensis TaxID=1124761 RepID=A0A7X0CA60_9ACTN|nr:collagenase [Nonomuraea muscovyensis]MBB6351403.1 microbial collagenase [Nonomuraea muscovyensis]